MSGLFAKIFFLLSNIQIEILDVINEDLESFENYKEEVKDSLSENFDIKSEKDWKQTQKNLVTLSKLVKLNLEFDEYKESVNNILYFINKKHLIIARKFCNTRNQKIFYLLLQICINKNYLIFE